MIPIWILLSGNNYDILRTSLYLNSNGKMTTGTITDMEELPHKIGSAATYRLVVEFKVDEKTYTVKSYSSYHVPEYNRGDSIQVIYDPNDPNTAQVDISSERWFFPILQLLPF